MCKLVPNFLLKFSATSESHSCVTRIESEEVAEFHVYPVGVAKLPAGLLGDGLARGVVSN